MWGKEKFQFPWLVLAIIDMRDETYIINDDDDDGRYGNFANKDVNVEHGKHVLDDDEEEYKIGIHMECVEYNVPLYVCM